MLPVAGALCWVWSQLLGGIRAAGAAEGPVEWQAPEGEGGGCPVRVVEDSAELHPDAAEPLLLHLDASRTRSSRREAFLEEYGQYPAAVYPRHVFEILQPYGSIASFAARHLGSPRKRKKDRSPPLVLSFQESYKGADRLRAALKRDFSLPPGFDRGTWSLSLGGPGSGIPFHSTHPGVVSAVLQGRKRWVLLPPGSLERHQRLYWATGPTHLVPGEWPPDVLHELREAGLGAVECTQPPGTVLFVPHWWWHATVNEGDCVAVNAQVDASAPAGSLEGYQGRQQLLGQVHSALHSLQGREGGSFVDEGLVELGRRTAAAVEQDPLQILRSKSEVLSLWTLLLGTDSFLRRLAAEVHRVVAWAKRGMRAALLLPEQCASLAVSLFPFGVSGMPAYAQLPRRHPARAAVRSVLKLAGAALVSKFADDRYRPLAAVLHAAMLADLGQEGRALAVMSRHVGAQAARVRYAAGYAASLSGAFEPAWERWLRQAHGAEL